MRLSRRFAPAFLALALLAVLPYDSMPRARVVHPALHARVKSEKTPDPQPFGAECRVGVTGSDVVAYCHNPYPDTDHVSLHIECDRWWDLDTDTAPVEAGPAMTVRLSGRCWENVRSAWVGHAR
ncbi:hypothetical protein [Streptomyces chiangmaiensis]|uniref:Secreted protein n=1 Tax=Streptomyces chiangmaiensis TaxID=766497 RepID=A0ABU7FQ00_9ACTN|nr:hypothetical protein [Streptomyces chiangmaiensis]MED7826024.1 hypothetical protein [Streptomyces chiangmaiensis]